MKPNKAARLLLGAVRGLTLFGMVGGKKALLPFFPCNFYKRKN